jgi:hypothetical protein
MFNMKRPTTDPRIFQNRVAGKCQMTMGPDETFNTYWECGKPAKATYEDNLRGCRRVCGLHLRQVINNSKKHNRDPQVKLL